MVCWISVTLHIGSIVPGAIKGVYIVCWISITLYTPLIAPNTRVFLFVYLFVYLSVFFFYTVKV